MTFNSFRNGPLIGCETYGLIIGKREKDNESRNCKSDQFKVQLQFKLSEVRYNSKPVGLARLLHRMSKSPA